ncbi:MAG: peptide chain release factor N(5)-glutamine methyltransferase [Patescibacteria group bacterium]
MIISQLLREGAFRLSPRLDASLCSRVLLAFVLGISQESLVARSSDVVIDENEQRFFTLIERCFSGIPLAYLVQRKEFYGLDFYVDERVLIPRPETELLVDEVLKVSEKASCIADIGTGSGCIAVSLASKLPLVHFLAVDISPDALEVARRNISSYQFIDQIQLFQSDLLNSICDREIDIVVANLPYIGEDQFRFLDSEVEKNEPHVALFGGHDGLQLYKKLFQQILVMPYQPQYLLGEFGFGQADELRLLLNQFFDQKWSIVLDGAGIERIFVVKL